MNKKRCFGIRNNAMYCITGYTNDWVRKPLTYRNENIHHTPIPIEEKLVTRRHVFNRDTEYEYRLGSDTEALWKSYEKDFYELTIHAKRWKDSIYLYLDDISDLPIDYEKITISTGEQEKSMMESKKNEGR